MMQNILDSVESLVMFKPKSTPEQQVKELDEQIEVYLKELGIVE